MNQSIRLFSSQNSRRKSSYGLQKYRDVDITRSKDSMRQTFYTIRQDYQTKNTKSKNSFLNKRKRPTTSTYRYRSCSLNTLKPKQEQQQKTKIFHQSSRIHSKKNTTVSISLKSIPSTPFRQTQSKWRADYLKQILQKYKTEQPTQIQNKQWKFYQGQETTPRPSLFRIVLQGDPLTRIFGNNDGQNILRRYDKLNQKLFKDIAIYKLKKRMPKGVVTWKY